jgi:hypothetical protein
MSFGDFHRPISTAVVNDQPFHLINTRQLVRKFF